MVSTETLCVMAIVIAAASMVLTRMRDVDSNNPMQKEQVKGTKQ
jgi:hypothetical protein